MEWKPITLPADGTTSDESSAATSWQGTGARGNYTLAALTSQFFAGNKADAERDTTDADAVVSYLITGPASTCLESAVRVSSDGKHKWMSKAEYLVPESELLVTTKAFCEYYEVNGEFPDRRTWKEHAALYLDVVAGKATPPIRLVAEDLDETSEGEDDDESEESKCESAHILLWSEKSASPSAERMRAAAAMFAVFNEPTDGTAEGAE